MFKNHSFKYCFILHNWLSQSLWSSAHDDIQFVLFLTRGIKPWWYKIHRRNTNYLAAHPTLVGRHLQNHHAAEQNYNDTPQRKSDGSKREVVVVVLMLGKHRLRSSVQNVCRRLFSVESGWIRKTCLTVEKAAFGVNQRSWIANTANISHIF